MRVFAGVILALSALGIGCQTTPGMSALKLSDDDFKTRNQILQVAPVGSPISKAEELLGENGFTCTQNVDEQGQYLYCDLQKSEGAFVGRRWQILIRHDGAAITDVIVSSGLIGL